jgi:hypothetical protein
MLAKWLREAEIVCLWLGIPELATLSGVTLKAESAEFSASQYFEELA